MLENDIARFLSECKKLNNGCLVWQKKATVTYKGLSYRPKRYSFNRFRYEVPPNYEDLARDD
jgi:hypothetical protein